MAEEKTTFHREQPEVHEAPVQKQQEQKVKKSKK